MNIRDLIAKNLAATRDHVVEKWRDDEWKTETRLLTREQAHRHIAFEMRRDPRQQLRLAFRGLA